MADLRQLARLARSEGVSLTLHGVRVDPLKGAPKGSETKGGTAGKDKAPKADSQGRESMETSDSRPQVSKRSQRSTQRLQDFQKEKQREAVCAARWQPIIQLVTRQIRAKHTADVWTAWMRSRCARAKLRRILWKAWTTPNPAIGSSRAAMPWVRAPTCLATLSLRDAYILRRVRAFAAQANLDWANGPMKSSPGCCHRCPPLEDDMAEEGESEVEDPQPPSEEDDVGGTPAAAAHATVRTRTDAGLQTPGSVQRRGKKKSRGRRTP